ncbi:hypothetical protein ACIBG7_15075 [Nonomuraea sp. NPDC050328]|uniref:hypothetical protein n=1 Tax=Nonomuraea sp. NPDC050328 TaxID=3364361 RepID=UPI0037AC24D4
MTHLVRTVRHPLLGKPHAGALEYVAEGRPAVPLTLSATQELLLDDPVWARELATAATTAASVLEAEHGLTAPAEQPVLNDVLDERNAYRHVLDRLIGAPTLGDFNQAMGQAREVVEHWAGQR